MAFTAQADAAAVSSLLGENGQQTLVNGLPHAISDEGKTRHWMLESFTKMALAAVQDLQRAGEAHREQLQADGEAAEAAIKEGETSVEVAGEAEKAADADVQQREEKLEKCKAALAKTKGERADAQSARDKVAKKYQQLENQKNEVTFQLEGQFLMLLGGGWEDEESRDAAIESVTQLLTELKAETSLIAAAPGALVKRPADRQEFDEFTLSSVKEILEARVASVTAELEAAAPGREDAEAEALGLSALADREGDEESTAMSDFIEAKAAAEKAVDARKEATAELARRHKALKKHSSTKAAAEESAKRIAETLEAAERLVAFEYKAAEPPAADVAMDTAAATEDVEMAGEQPVA